ncbi:hypothetical protein D3C86_1715900 [compost metagenome]
MIIQYRLYISLIRISLGSRHTSYQVERSVRIVITDVADKHTQLLTLFSYRRSRFLNRLRCYRFASGIKVQFLDCFIQYTQERLTFMIGEFKLACQVIIYRISVERQQFIFLRIPVAQGTEVIGPMFIQDLQEDRHFMDT